MKMKKLRIDQYLMFMLAYKHESIDAKLPVIQMFYVAKSDEERRSCLMMLEVFKQTNSKGDENKRKKEND